MPARNKVGMLALPANARGLRQRLFHHRRRVHEHLHFARLSGTRDDVLSKRLLHALHHLVVVAISGIDRDVAAITLLQRGERIVIRCVGQSKRDDGPRLRPERARVAPLLGAFSQPAHVAVLSGGDELGQSFPDRAAKLCRAEADHVEPEGKGSVAYPVTKGFRFQRTIFSQVNSQSLCLAAGMKTAPPAGIGGFRITG